MNALEFINAIRIAVQLGAAKGIINILNNPPGRNPSLENATLSSWYLSLSAEDRESINSVIRLATKQATYNFLLVLDGALAIESSELKGTLKLLWEQAGAQELINNPDGEQLSQLFKGNESILRE